MLRHRLKLQVRLRLGVGVGDGPALQAEGRVMATVREGRVMRQGRVMAMGALTPATRLIATRAAGVIRLVTP
jgi:hypothetical protein